MTNERGKSDRPIRTEEVPEQNQNTGGGGDGGKGSGQGKLEPAKRVPGSEPGRRATVRWSGYGKQRRRIRSCGSPRSCTTSMTSTCSASAYRSLKRGAAPGVDGETWQHYGEDLEANLQDLSRKAEARSVSSASRCGGCTSPRLTGGNGRSV